LKVLIRQSNPFGNLLQSRKDSSRGFLYRFLREAAVLVQQIRIKCELRLTQVAVRNDQAKSGLWVVDSVRKAIYALTSLSVPQRFKAAQQVAAGALWDGISQTWKARAPSYA
jgi:hypothetical protein